MNYQARWIAPDGIMMQFGILAILLMYMAIHSEKHYKVFLNLAAIVSGLAFGTKYPGGIFLISLIYSAYIKNRRNRIESVLAHLMNYVVPSALFFLTFLITTPGVIIEPFKFLHDVYFEMHHYATEHGGFTVKPGIEHASLMGYYLCIVLFSKYLPISCLISAFILFGVYILIRFERELSIWLLLTPIIYLIFFSMQKVMVVRNILILLPFAAICFGRGVAYICGRLSSKYVKLTLIFLIVFLLIVNLKWLSTASLSIKSRGTINHQQDIISYLHNHKDKLYFMSNSIYSIISPTVVWGFKNVTPNIKSADYVLLVSTEIHEWQKWPVNRSGNYDVVSGPFEVNWDYYSSWAGDMRVIATSKSIAERLGVIQNIELHN